MANFDFVKAVDWPEIYSDCAHAESYALTDPRSACIYSRRAVEQCVDYLYDVLALPIPYQDDLSARINDAQFKVKVGAGIATKLNLIRKCGNHTVHDQKPIQARAGLDALRELHHVMVWAAFHHSANPQAVPLKAVFDPALAVKSAPVPRDEVAKLIARFQAQDEARAKALAEKDELAAAKDAEIAELREQITQARAANQKVDDRDYSEAQTRDLFIDVLLAEAGWSLSEERDREFQVTGMPTKDGIGFVDYVLWGADGLPLAIVEAKRTTKSPQLGQQQAKLYADCLEAMTGRRPVMFYTNGYEHWIWDDAAGYPPREVQGFYTRNELELLLHRRHARKSLTDTAIDSGIVERHYQHHAIRAIDDAFTAKQREALLVMATGAGKTRTVIALVKQLMEAGWVKRVLFLADRTATRRS
jgi:type I restriction enzyme, R subunit